MDKLCEDKELIVQRLSCDCFYPGHVLDVTVELADDGKRVIDITLNFYMDGEAPLKYRLKQIWKLLRGEEGQLADFILRKEDVPQLIQFLSRIVPHVGTTGTADFF